MVLIVSSGSFNLRFWEGKKAGQWLLAGWIVCVLGLLPSSPMRELYAAIPKQSHWDTRKEILKFDQLSQGETISVQTTLGAHFNRTGILAITDDINGNCVPLRRDLKVHKPMYLVFAKSLNHYLIDDLEICLKRLNQSKDYEIIPGYHHLTVYKKAH